MPSRRRLIRTNAETETVPFAFEIGKELICINDATGEKLTGVFNAINKNGNKIKIKSRWINLNEFVITRSY